MKTYEFFLDQKVSTWMRTEFEVEADNLNEAMKIAKEKLERGDLEQIAWEEIDDTKEVLLPCDNNGQSTADLFFMEQNGDVFEVYNNKVDKVEKL